jgi:ABC-type glycerol-3-phosphate transport system substrate-binding protein
MRRLASVFLLLVLVTSVASCAAPTPEIVEVEKEVPVEVEVEVTKEVIVEKEVQVEVPAERINIVYWIFAAEGAAKHDTGELWSDFYTRVFNEYEAEHPGIDIDFALRGIEAGGTTTYIDAAVAAGTPPDVYFDSRFRAKKFYSAGLFEDMAPALTEEDKAAYDPTIFGASVAPDGTLWSIPCSGGLWNYIVNKTMFEEAGLEDLLPAAPDYTWTTEEFLEACRAINDPPDHYCTAFFAKTPSFDVATNNFMGGFPGCDSYYDTEKGEFIASSPECMEVWEFLHTLVEEGLAVPGPAGFVDDDIDPYWMRQDVAMQGGSNWYAGITKRGIEEGTVEPFEYLLVSFPNKPGAPPPPVATGDPYVWTVFKQDDPKKLQAIYDLVNYMQQPEIASEIAGGWATMPVRTDAPNPFEGDPDNTAWLEASRKFGTRDYYYSGDVPCNFNEVRQAWAEARQAFWDVDADIQAVMDEFDERATAIVAECQ